MPPRFIGIDIGAETVKLTELTWRGEDNLEWTRRELIEHHKEPASVLRDRLQDWRWNEVAGAAITGRLSRQVDLPRIPTKQAQAAGFRFRYPGQPATVVSIGSHGFSVLELRASGVEVFRENSRCSQGTGNFLRQLVKRFELNIEEASALCAPVEKPAPLSGRCPVILKTDMTHLANKGESRARILAGLYDAVCENVQVLIKPRISPSRVLLVGGVSHARRIRENFRRFLHRHGLRLMPDGGEARFLEALGSAVLAAERPMQVPALDALMLPPVEAHLERVPSLCSSLPQVVRMKRPPATNGAGAHRLVVGLDIGSTGSKVVALDDETRDAVWEGYVGTGGNPVVAAQTLVRQLAESPAGQFPILALGVTGSGREIVGSLLSSCYGVERVYVLNEIAAHAEGALHFDSRVDTIFEIGGQDAKYIRLADGRVIDAAMNEACSAGTGSFIEEQGRKFSGIRDVVQLGEEALIAECGVSLGQHCSVFMAEIIDEAVAAGVDNRSIIAGIYDSIVQNYLNRVKGSRSVGQTIFCQGMPFSADALAAAVARQTGSRVIVPPNPGTVGALGIALLTLKAIPAETRAAMDLVKVLTAKVVRKDTFVCKSQKACGGSGNRCRIDRITTRVAGRRRRFTWGGSCSLWDRGTGKKKLPDLTPDPFREREDLVSGIVERVTQQRGRKRVAMTHEFQLKGLFPFFATFVHELGFDVVVEASAGQKSLKRGIEEANIPYCAPMQLHHGLVSAMSESRPDYLFLPMVRATRRVGDEPHAVVCPIVQGSPDLLRWDLGKEVGATVISPVIDIGARNLESADFIDSCRRVAASLGISGLPWWRAYQIAIRGQERFDARCFELGQEALTFCRAHDIIPVVVLGRPYTIHNEVLNSNVPALLREQGAMAIPVDCYRVDEEVPVFGDMYWGHGQRNLRAAHQVRRSPGVYSLWCSNYSCGPDSFNLHFYAYAMEGKPFAIIETDGHSGDAGTKTRVEAFLHCVREDLQGRAHTRRPNDLKRTERDGHGLAEIRRRGERLIVTRMGPGAETLAAAMRGVGMDAECLEMPDREALRLGRRHTSGKECVPLSITLGSLLQRLERDRDTDQKFAYFMPTANGPCRFGMYNVLFKVVLERLGWKDRVRIWSPVDSDYFEGVPSGFASLVFTGFATDDMLLEALHDTRPTERWPGAANAVFERYHDELTRLMESASSFDLRVPAALLQAANGRLYGCARLLERAAGEFAAITARRPVPTVALVGEIYARCDDFANDFIVDKLEARGLRVRFAPFTEWLEYSDYLSHARGEQTGFGAKLSSMVQNRIQARAYKLMADRLGWPKRTSVPDSVEAATPYVRKDLSGEAVLTVGGPLHEWREGLIAGVVSVGPMECMPTKIAEAQFFHIAEEEGLASLTIPLNGDPIDPEVIDGFAFEVQRRFRQRHKTPAQRQPSTPRSRVQA